MAHRRTASVPRTILLVTMAGGLALGGCTTTRSTVTRSGKAIGRGIDEAVTAPLEDLNLKRTDIPLALRQAVADPYALNGLTRCEAIAGEVGRIDAALGPDLDEPTPPDGRRMNEKGADYAAHAALDAVRDTTTGVIPMRGWVRRLTGAERHQKQVREAVVAGTVRRAYLKGVGMQRNCAPPAAPSWFEPVDRVDAAPPPPPPPPTQAPADQGGS